MRTSRTVKAEHHAEIVSAASRVLRTRGIAGTSVVDLMQEAGFTHGGFYRHFASKDALVAEASAAAFEEFQSRMEQTKAGNSPEAEVQAYVAGYLSDCHLANPQDGCPIATLGAEAAREQRQVQQAFADGTEGLIEKLSAAHLGSAAERRAKAVTLLINLVGAIVIARAVGEGDLRQEILEAGRDQSHLK